MIYEMRVYEAVPGRLPDIIKRFDTKTLKIWEKHGIRQAGFFTTMVGEHSQHLTYFLAWETLAEREQKWGAFMVDPDWIAARAETEKNGPIVARVSNQLLAPTAFSSVK
ncbi:MAG: NIPSNAP family protein [Xanthobacteraceae bacterium]